LADRVISLEDPVVMGILNLTPDSFSDGGELPTVESAVRRAEEMVAEGAAVLDLGGESTRPGADPVSAEDEVGRILPVLEALAGRVAVPLSVDTRKAAVARRALRAGASIVNDVSGFAYDDRMAATVADHGAGVVLMHMRGTPADMRERSSYRDLMGEIVEELRPCVERARAAGVADEAIVLDPGIGFAKTSEQSFRIVRELERLGVLGFPIMVGASRKSFLGQLLGVSPRERVTAGAVVAALAYGRGARVFRTHDVEATVQALATARAVEEGLGGEVRTTR
jgi:dihydropteroate synthase